MAKANFIPVKLQKIGSKVEISRDEVKDRTMKDLQVTEADLEEFVRKNISVIFPEGEETLLIVGQQVKNKESGRADLVAVDGEGNIVLIELKRDKDDIVARKEAFEFQAIRYAASYALIETPQELAQKLFVPYIEKHKSEAGFQEELSKGLTSSELAFKILDNFLQTNQSQETFNRYQRIVLIASAFDLQTLSACAWLAKNRVDISCLTISPVEFNQQCFFQIEQLIPPPTLEEYFVGVAETPEDIVSTSKGTGRTKSILPKMSALFEWGLVSSGDKIYIRNHEDEVAETVNPDQVRYQGNLMTYNEWGQKVTGWQSINIYEWTVHEKSRKILDALRREKLAQIEESAALNP